MANIHDVYVKLICEPVGLVVPACQVEYNCREDYEKICSHNVNNLAGFSMSRFSNNL